MFTVGTDAHAWTIRRPLSLQDITTAPSGNLDGCEDASSGQEQTKTALEILVSRRDRQSNFNRTVLHLVEREVLLAPLTGFGKGFVLSGKLPNYDAWAGSIMSKMPVQPVSQVVHPILQRLWMSTAEGRHCSPGADVLAEFCALYIAGDSHGHWKLQVHDRLRQAVQGVHAALGSQIGTKRAYLSRKAHDGVGGDAVAQEWKRLLALFLDDKALGSVAAYEGALNHLLLYFAQYPHVSDVQAFFNQDVPRTPLSAWIAGRGNSPSTQHSIVSSLSSFFAWLLTEDQRFRLEGAKEESVKLDPKYVNPISQKNYDLSYSNLRADHEKPGETVQLALPTEYFEQIDQILFENDMAWPKTRSVDWITATDAQTGKETTVYCPVLPYAIAVLTKLPIRQVQVRRLDSGEGDAERFDLSSGEWVKNDGPNGGYWLQHGVRQPKRGTLRKIEDNFSSRTLCGFFINSSKGSDRRTLFDERSGYVIQWHNEAVIELILKMRAWQERYNSVSGPLQYTQVRNSVFERMAANAAKRRPDAFYLFRYPAGNSSKFKSSPPSSQQLRMFWYELLAELERRQREVYADTPALISSWIGNSPQSSPYTLHGLRHGGLTRLAMAGVEPWILQTIVADHGSILQTIYYIKPNAAHVSDTLNEAYADAMRGKQKDFQQFLTTRTVEEVHRNSVGGLDAVPSLEKSRRDIDGKRVGQISHMDCGFCPNGRTRCDEGGRIVDRTEFKRKEIQKTYGPVPLTVGNAPDCIRCRFFITGTPFMEGLRLKVNEVSVRTHECAKRYHEMRQVIDQQEVSYAQERRAGGLANPSTERNIHIVRQELKAEGDVMGELIESLNAHVQMWQKVRQLARRQIVEKADGVPALLFEEVPDFKWGAVPRLEVVDELCYAAKWFPSIRTDGLRRERREMIMKLLVRNRRLPALALMSEEEADLAAGTIVAGLYRRWGRSAVQKLFEDQETFEGLGIGGEVDELIGEALKIDVVSDGSSGPSRQLKQVPRLGSPS